MSQIEVRNEEKQTEWNKIPLVLLSDFTKITKNIFYRISQNSYWKNSANRVFVAYVGIFPFYANPSPKDY